MEMFNTPVLILPTRVRTVKVAMVKYARTGDISGAPSSPLSGLDMRGLLSERLGSLSAQLFGCSPWSESDGLLLCPGLTVP